MRIANTPDGFRDMLIPKVDFTLISPFGLHVIISEAIRCIIEVMTLKIH